VIVMLPSKDKTQNELKEAAIWLYVGWRERKLQNRSNLKSM
jgi:hypothetical protein